MSRTTLEKWIGRGKIPVVANKSGREEVSREALEFLIERVRARGYSHDGTHHLATILMPPKIDGHRTAERQSLAYHRLIADRLNKNIVENARKKVEERVRRGGVDPRLTDLWLDLLSRSLDDIRAVITADSEAARELRAIAPFTGVLSQEERQRVLDTVR